MSWVSSGWAHNCLGLYYIVHPWEAGHSLPPRPHRGLASAFLFFVCFPLYFLATPGNA